MASINCRLTLSSLLLLLILSSTGLCQQPATINKLDSSIPSPLIYTRLRFDYNYLPIYRGLQRRYPYDERVLQLVANSSLISRSLPPDSGGVRLSRQPNDSPQDVRLKFYMNDNKNVNELDEDELIWNSLHQVYMSNMNHINLMDYDNEDDRKRASDPKLVSAERCNRELDYLLDRFDKDRGLDPELATFFDSFAGEESGVLMGNHYWVGNWKACNRRHLFDLPSLKASGELLRDPNQTEFVDQSAFSFTGRYCVASIKSPKWKEMIATNEAELKNYWKTDNQHMEYRNFFRIQVGICLPESCDSVLIKPELDKIKRMALHRLSSARQAYDLTDVYCLPDDGSELRQPDFAGWLLIAVTTVWLSAIALASALDYHDLLGTSRFRKANINKNEGQERKTCGQKFVVSMSIIESWLTLATIRRETSAKSAKRGGVDEQKGEIAKPEAKTSPKDLLFLNFLKVIIMPNLILAHVGMLFYQYGQYQLDFDPMPLWLRHWETSSTFYCDWYFCMTGIITAYATFSSKPVSKITRFQWIYSVFHRYMRLAPAYLLTLWYARSLFKLTGSGPLWDYGTSNSGYRAVCQRESWLYPLALASNFHPIHEECIIPSWYISVDFQFYLITPFLLILLDRSPKTGWLSILSMTCLSLVGRFLRYFTDPRAQHLELMHNRLDCVMRNNWDMHRTYLHPWHRMAAYLVGLLCGHYAYMVRTGRWTSPFYSDVASKEQSPGSTRSKSASRSKKFWCTVLAFTGIYFAFFMAWASFFTEIIMLESLMQHARYFASFCYTFIHVNAALGPGLLSMALLFGLWPTLRKFMEHQVWTYLSRINFFVYLFQVEFLLYLFQSASRLWDTSLLFVLAAYFLVIPLLYSAATLATLFLSNPLARLETEFIQNALARRAEKRKTKAS